VEDIIAIEYDVTPTIANMLAMTQELHEARQRAEAAERKLNDVLPQYVAQMADAIKRAEAAESALRLATHSTGSTTVLMTLDKYTDLLAAIDRYGADQWRRGNAGKDPQEFDEWQKEAQP